MTRTACTGFFSLLCLVGISLTPVHASDPCGCLKSCTAECGQACEPCAMICCPEIKTVTVKKHCWEVECDYVCIPKVHCPLFDFLGFGNGGSASGCCDSCGSEGCQGQCCGSAPLGAKIRRVRKLKKVEYECEKQVVEWSIAQAPLDCVKCCNGPAAPSCCAPLH